MKLCFFVSDLHGHPDRYQKLFLEIHREKPAAVFLGGDLLPSGSIFRKSLQILHRDFVNDFLVAELKKLRDLLGNHYPRIFIILGNDDPRFEEASILSAAGENIWEYCHFRKIQFEDYLVFGYAFVPPSPFQLKDWERYDVSRYVDPGCVSPEEGKRTIPVSLEEKKYSTIQKDLERLVGNNDLKRSIFLFHSPPYRTNLDRAALDGKMIDYVPLDVNVGSIAMKRFIKERQPMLTLHGHIHESARLTSHWQDRIGETHLLSAAHDGPELALVSFNLNNLSDSRRLLL